MPCTHIQSCELFVQFALNPALEIWQKHYCNGDFKTCSRYQLSKSGKPVPLTLLPNGKKIQTVTSTEEFGTTALFNCVAKNRVRMARSLLLTGINLDDSNVEGTTPLMAAVEKETVEIVKLFLEHDANTNLVNMHGQTAYDIAVEKNNAELIALLDKYDHG